MMHMYDLYDFYDLYIFCMICKRSLINILYSIQFHKGDASFSLATNAFMKGAKHHLAKTDFY